MTSETAYDVLAVNIDTKRITLMGENMSERSAEAVVNMAVMRRGTERGVIWDANGTRLGAFYTGDQPNAEIASQLVTAVNSHAALLEAAERIDAWLVAPDTSDKAIDEMQAIVRAAIDAARRQP